MNTERKNIIKTLVLGSGGFVSTVGGALGVSYEGFTVHEYVTSGVIATRELLTQTLVEGLLGAFILSVGVGLLTRAFKKDRY